MKKLKKISALFVLLCMLFSVIAVFPVSADPANDSARYTQKIVSVVYDNSGSMLDYNREPAARYSLEMLMALLDERDKMIIMPMNDGRNGYPVSSSSAGIEVDLAAEDRDKELDRIMALPQLAVTNAGTPHESMGYAIECLEKNGLTKSGSQDDGSDKEYWLVILTDGAFNANSNLPEQDDKIQHYIKDYPNLHTVYASFGNGGVDLSGSSKLNSYQFYPYHTTEKDLAATIQQIANKVSGRYTLSEENYSVNGKTLTINLEKLPISLSSLSLVVQDCGATVSSVLHDGKKIDLEKACVIKPSSALKMKDGFSCEVLGDPYLVGGTLVFEFTAPIDKNNIAIFAEPALKISYYFEAQVNGAWQRVDVPYIINNLGKGDNIRVGYEVYEQANNTLVDLEQVFGDVEAKVFYVNKYYKMGENIPLAVGTNDISIDVSVMDGAYTLRASETLTIEEDPSAFRIEVAGDNEFPAGSVETTAIFTVYIKNQPATEAQLKNYAYSVTATSPAGYSTDVKATLGSDGRISAKLTIEQNKFDVYTIDLKVESPEGLVRTKSHSITLVPSSLDLAITSSDHLSITQYELDSNTQGIIFELSTNGLPFPLNNSFSKYKLTVDGVDMTDKATITGNTLTFIPTTEVLGSMADNPGDKEVVLSLESSTHPNLSTSAKATLTVIKTVYTITTIDKGNKSFDRFDLENADAVLYFSVLRDGISLTEEELKTAYENGNIQLSFDRVFTNFTLPCDVVTSIETVDGTPVIAVSVIKDMVKYFEWHYSAFITGGDKSVTVTYRDAEKVDYFTILPSATGQHVLRISLLVLVHILIIYIIVYIVGFFVAKPLPTGVVVQISPHSTDIAKINTTIWPIIKWHIQRFVIPWKVLSNQSLDQFPYCDGIEFKFDRKHLSPYFMATDNSIFNASITGTRAKRVIETFQNRVKIDNDFESSVQDIITELNVRIEVPNLFRRSTAVTALEPITLESEGYFIQYSLPAPGQATRFMNAVTFIKL